MGDVEGGIIQSGLAVGRLFDLGMSVWPHWLCISQANSI